MNNQDWAPEPWAPEDRWYNIWFNDANGNEVGERGEDGDEGYKIDKATRDRITACVNACAGVPTEMLEDILRRGITSY
jgi:hypothetical protein